MTGCFVTSSTRSPRKYTTRPSRKLALYCSTVRSPMIRSSRSFPFPTPQDVFQNLSGGCFRYFAKALVWTGDNGNFQYRRMRVDDALDLQCRNVFSTGDDDVLGAVLDFYITIGMKHGEVPCMEPSSAECILRCLGIPVVAFHDTVSADDEFAALLAVRLDAGHVFANDALLHHQISHALPRLQ